MKPLDAHRALVRELASRVPADRLAVPATLTNIRSAD
jgi:hypothetical protein